MLKDLAAKLIKNGFDCHVYEDAGRAKEAVLELIPQGSSVGFGGSVTVQDMGLYQALQSRGSNVYWHWMEPQRREDMFACGRDADYYLTSTNAITQDGHLVNIDGTGNRVAGMFAGPKQVFVICGRNKICGDLTDALARIHREACPKNARRLGLSTPCAATGKCTNCASAQRMCNVTTIIEHPPGGRSITVFLVDEDLGY